MDYQLLNEKRKLEKALKDLAQNGDRKQMVEARLRLKLLEKRMKKLYASQNSARLPWKN